jgi:hypothetical protein
MEKEQKKDRWWVADAVYETGSVLLKVALLVPRVITRIAKDNT